MIHGPPRGKSFTMYLPLVDQMTGEWLSFPPTFPLSVRISHDAQTWFTVATPYTFRNYWFQLELTRREMSAPFVFVEIVSPDGGWTLNSETIWTTTPGDRRMVNNFPMPEDYRA